MSSQGHGPVVAGLSSDQSAVVGYALLEAERRGTSVRLVHCHVDSPTLGARSVLEKVSVLDRAREVVQESGSSVDVAYSLQHGEAGTSLIVEAAQAAVVLVGARDESWLGRMLGGDLTGRLVAGAACPVVVIPPAFPAEHRLGGVVVTLDGDTSAAGPLRYGFEQAEARGEGLHVLHAAPVGTSEDDTEVLIDKVTAEVTRWNALTPTVPTRLSLTSGDALTECILATAQASLLVIGRPHGHSPLFALARPVALRVLREAQCPVAIVPAHYSAS
jgi:nucleotide-binding universal stress UspA family protein